jgi:glycerate-2-kinase
MARCWRARAQGVDPDEFMRRGDAHNFFERLGDAVITDPAGNHLRDLRILLTAESFVSN